MLVPHCDVQKPIMSFYYITFSIILIIGSRFVKGEVYVTDEDFEHTIASYRSMPAKFGEPLPEEGLKGRAVKAHPENGCQRLKPPPIDPHAYDDASRKWIAVMR